MPDRITTALTALAAQPLRRAAPFLCLAVCVILAGCASDGAVGGGGGSPMFFADAGKYQFHNCDRLASAAKRQSERQRELKELIDKAEQGAAGQIVSALAYRSDYAAVNEDLRVLQSAVRDKNCVTNAKGNKAIR